MPTIFIFAGPNGAGKTSLARDTLPDGVPLISPDDIARDQRLPPVAAAREAIRNRDAHFKRASSFAIDTTFSGGRPYDILTAASDYGFSTHVIAILLSSVSLAKERVADRIKLGGHAVPSADIERRFGRCIENLRSMPPLFTELSLFDNSDAAPRHFLTITPDHAVILRPPPQHIVAAAPDFARPAVEKAVTLPPLVRSNTVPLSSNNEPRETSALQRLEKEAIERQTTAEQPPVSKRPDKPRGPNIRD